MEEYQSIHFWIVSTERDPGRIEVPVDAGSDIVRPINFNEKTTAMDLLRPGKSACCESPVDVMDVDHHRSISAISACTTGSGCGDLPRLALCHERDWSTSSIDLDLGCGSGRSCSEACEAYESMSSDGSSDNEVDTFTIIDEFDSLMKEALPEIRVKRAYRGRRSLLGEFDFGAPKALHKEKNKGFGFHHSRVTTKSGPAVLQTAPSGKAAPTFSGFGDLRRRISRFMLTRREPTKVEKSCAAQAVADEGNMGDADMDTCAGHGIVVAPSGEADHGHPVENRPDREVDFLFLFPRSRSRV